MWVGDRKRVMTVWWPFSFFLCLREDGVTSPAAVPLGTEPGAEGDEGAGEGAAAEPLLAEKAAEPLLAEKGEGL